MCYEVWHPTGLKREASILEKVVPMALEQELKTYEQNVGTWAADRAGKYVLIHGDQVVDFLPPMKTRSRQVTRNSA